MISVVRFESPAGVLGPAHIEPGQVLHPAIDVVDRDDVLEAVLTQASQEDLLRAGYGDATSLAKQSIRWRK